MNRKGRLLRLAATVLVSAGCAVGGTAMHARAEQAVSATVRPFFWIQNLETGYWTTAHGLNAQLIVGPASGRFQVALDDQVTNSGWIFYRLVILNANGVSTGHCVTRVISGGNSLTVTSANCASTGLPLDAQRWNNPGSHGLAMTDLYDFETPNDPDALTVDASTFGLYMDANPVNYHEFQWFQSN